MNALAVWTNLVIYMNFRCFLKYEIRNLRCNIP